MPEGGRYSGFAKGCRVILCIRLHNRWNLNGGVGVYGLSISSLPFQPLTEYNADWRTTLWLPLLLQMIIAVQS